MRGIPGNQMLTVGVAGDYFSSFFAERINFSAAIVRNGNGLFALPESARASQSLAPVYVI